MTACVTAVCLVLGQLAPVAAATCHSVVGTASSSLVPPGEAANSGSRMQGPA